MINNYRTYELKGSAKKGRTGLYANYPFNTIKPYANFGTSTQYNHQYNDPYIKVPDEDGLKHQQIPSDIVSFHSPDTMFTNPYLSTTELKLYGVIKGFSEQSFNYPDEHPEGKILSNFSAFAMILGGVAEALISLVGKRTFNTPDITVGPGITDAAGAMGGVPGAGNLALKNAVLAYNAALNTYYGTSGNGFVGDGITAFISGVPDTGVGQAKSLFLDPVLATIISDAASPLQKLQTIEYPKWAYLDNASRLLGGINHLTFYFSEGADTTAKLIDALVPYRQYALQMKSHGLYDNMEAVKTSSTSRFKIEDSFYTKNTFQDVPLYQNTAGSVSYKINNLKRASHVTLRTKTGPYGHTNEFEGPKLFR